MDFKKCNYLEQGTSHSSMASTQSEEHLNSFNQQESVELDDDKLVLMDAKELNRLLKKQGIAKTQSHVKYKCNICKICRIKARKRTLLNRGKINQ